MANLGGSSGAGISSSQLSGVSSPNIQNIILSNSGVEQMLTIPTCKRFKLKFKGVAKLNLSYLPGETLTNYYTICAGEIYEETGLADISIDLYLNSNKDNLEIELISWSE